MPKAPKSATKPDASAPKRKPGPGLSKPVTPSLELAAIVGTEPLPRSAVVSKLWDHIRANGLQDPADRRTIVADDKLRAVFGQDRAGMLEMHRLIAPHLKAA